MTAGKLSVHLIGKVVATAVRYRWWTVLFGMAVSVLSVLYAINNLGINSDTAGMMSDTLQWRQDFDRYRAAFPLRDRNLVAVIDGPTADANQSYARDLTLAVREEGELFASAFFPAADEFFVRNGLLFLSEEQLEQLADRLFEAQPLLGRLAEDPTAAGLLNLLSTAVDETREAAFNADSELNAIFAELALTLDAARQEQPRPVAWGDILGAGTSQDSRQIVLIQPADDGSVVPARAAIDRLNEIGANLSQRYGDSIDLRLTGTLAMENEELSSIARSAETAGFAALAMVILVLLWALRSPVLLLISLVVLLSGLAMTAAFAGATVGDLNLLSVAFAVLYIGLGVDFILHMTLRLKELLATDMPKNEALVETARGVGTSLLICAITTAAGFFAFIPTDFTGVSQLGLIAGSGMFISLIVSLTLLPALISIFWRGPKQAAAVSRVRAVAPALPARVTVALAIILTLVSIGLVPSLEFDGNPVNLRDPDAESIRTLRELAADSEAPLFSLAVVEPDAASAASTAGALAALESVASADTLDSQVPEDQQQKLELLGDLSLIVGPTLRRFNSAPSDIDRMVSEMNGLVTTLSGSPTMSPAEQSFVGSAEAWLADWRDGSVTGSAAEGLERDMLGNLVDLMQRLARGLNATEFGREDLPLEFQRRWVSADGDDLVVVVPVEDLNDSEASRRFVGDVRSVAPRATGLPVVYQEASATVTAAFLTALAYAFAIVSILLLLFLRNIGDALLVLIPIAFAALLTAGFSVLLGLPLNFANIIALPLLVGVGVDSGIHMVHRMRTEPPKDGDPLHTSTSRAVLMSALTTVASFGNLAFSEHYGMASMGQLLTLGMATSLFAVLVLLPALIRLRSAQ